MKTPKHSLQERFEAIRQLPLEVSFQQVEQWVREQHTKPSLWSQFWRRLRDLN
ncbi:MAG: hypothetical protein AAFV95_04080 [Bacteroidota bacterium]